VKSRTEQDDIEFKRVRQLAIRYRTEARKHRGTIRQLAQDNADMRDSRCTSFVRCPKCKHIHDSAFICSFCGWDHSFPIEEAADK
jgi:hypothetical protein